MPRRYRTSRRRHRRGSRRARRRSFKKRYQKKSSLYAGSFKFYGFPREYFCKLRYVADYNLTATSNTNVWQVFKANSLFDPDFTGVGHQPLFYDTLCGSLGLYNKYLVLGCKAKLEFVNYSSSGSAELIWGFGDQDPSALSVDQVAEWPLTRRKMIGVQTGMNVTYGSHYAKISYLAGQKRIDPDNDFYADYNHDPTNLFLFWVGAHNPDDTTTSGVHVRVSLTYYCKFKDLIIPGQS